MNCKNLRYRTKKGIKYAYCSLLRKTLNSYDECNRCSVKEYKPVKVLNKVSRKHSKQESKRFSVFVQDKEKCCICGSKYGHIDTHEIFGGKNRSNSIKYGFVLYLCRGCHTKYTNDNVFLNEWKAKAQRYFEKNIGTREEFIGIFHRNYL